MQTATNPQTGETVVLIGDRWEKAERIASNDKGEKAYLVGGQWMTESGSSKSTTPAAPVTLGREGFAQSVREAASEMSAPSRFAVAFKGALDDAAVRAKQLLGGTITPEDEQSVIANRAVRETGSGLAGSITGQIAMTGGPAAMTQRALTGAASRMLPAGAAQTAAAVGTGAGLAATTNPVLEGESELKNAGVGALSGALGDAGTRILARVIQPLKPNANVAKLLEEGVVPTPGQAAGAQSILNRMEQRLTSIPFLGDAIKNSRNRAIDEANAAAMARALPTNAQGQITDRGRAAIEQVDNVLSQGYSDVLAKIGQVKPDVKFLQDVQAVMTNPDLALPPDVQKRFTDLMRQQVFDRAQNGVITAEVAKRVDSIFGTLARRYSSSQDGDMRALGWAMSDARTAMRDLIERNAPSQVERDALKDLNLKWANFKILERAASYLGAEEGRFTPAQLQSAVKAQSTPSRFAKGKALMQDLSDPAYAQLRQTVADSGTPERFLMSGALLGGDVLLGNPLLLSALGAYTGLAGTRAGSRYMIGNYGWQPGTSEFIRSLAPFATSGAQGFR